MPGKGKKGLGRGLGALIPEAPSSDSEENFDISFEINGENISEEDKKNILNIKIIDIEPNRDQPRKKFDKEKLEALSRSIQEHGLVQPILVKPNENGTYMIIAGERRWRASKMAGLKEIPCIVRDMEEAQIMELALVENLQREDLNPIEEAEGYKKLIDNFNLTQEEIGERVGKSRSAVANSLRLNNLSDKIKELVIEEKLTQGHARALLGVDSAEDQYKIASKILAQGLNVRQTENLVAEYARPKRKPVVKKSNPMTENYFKEVANDLGSKYGTKVKITERSANKGKIEFEYYSKDDFERILFELRRMD